MTRLIKFITATLATGLVAVAPAGAASGDANPENASLTETRWVIEKVIAGGAMTDVPQPPEPYLVLRNSGRFELFDGCNRTTGSHQIAARTIEVTQGGTTRKFCSDPDPKIQREIIAAMDTGVVSWLVSGTLLRLIRDDAGPGLLLRAAP